MTDKAFKDRMNDLADSPPAPVGDPGRLAFKARMSDWTDDPPQVAHDAGQTTDRAALPKGWPCATCRRLRTPVDMAAPTCDAFPLGIPDVMVMGLHDHKTPLPGDEGKMYLPLAGQKPLKRGSGT